MHVNLPCLPLGLGILKKTQYLLHFRGIICLSIKVYFIEKLCLINPYFIPVTHPSRIHHVSVTHLYRYVTDV